MKQYIEPLSLGKIVQFRPRGNSMNPKIKSGQLITVSPSINDVAVGDIVFCKVNGNIYVHLVNAIQGNRFQIANNHGKINGWTTKIYGKVIKIED